jgi:ankyrin repeat protein
MVVVCDLSVWVVPCVMWVGGAGEDGNVDAVRSWVASGADINVVDERGDTPLMVASYCHRAECVAEMLRLGADARRVNNYGSTALHWVAYRGGDGGGGAEVVRLLVAAGCDAAVRDNDGRTAVELARQRHDGDEWGRVVEGWVAAAMA